MGCFIFLLDSVVPDHSSLLSQHLLNLFYPIPTFSSGSSSFQCTLAGFSAHGSPSSSVPHPCCMCLHVNQTIPHSKKKNHFFLPITTKVQTAPAPSSLLLHRLAMMSWDNNIRHSKMKLCLAGRITYFF